MVIPPEVLALIQGLEGRGYQAWVVGGCVRDDFLGLTPHDWDICTDATPQETAACFSEYPLILAGEKHGTVGVVTSGGPVEITTFRREGDYADGRHPGWVQFTRTVEADLARRDFTINAMAYSPSRGLADPFGGRRDLEAGILRTVGRPEDRFREDGLRILRGVRFAARLSLQPEAETLGAMTGLASGLANQARERVYSELCGFLPWAKAGDLITFAPVVTAALPALAPCLGFAQHNPHHIYDVYTHTAHVVDNAPPRLPVRWAALLHDVAKPACFTTDGQGVGHFWGHGKQGGEMARRILAELRAPRMIQEQVATLVAYHGLTRELSGSDRGIARLLRKLGEPAVWDLLALDIADDSGKGTPPDVAPFQQFRQRLTDILAAEPCLDRRQLAVGGQELMALAQGPALGRLLNRLLEEVGDGVLENSKPALLARAAQLMEGETECTKPNK